MLHSIVWLIGELLLAYLNRKPVKLAFVGRQFTNKMQHVAVYLFTLTAIVLLSMQSDA